LLFHLKTNIITRVFKQERESPLSYEVHGTISLDQIQTAVKLEREHLRLTPEDFIEAYKGLLWLIESMLQSAERYWQSRVRFLRGKDVDVISASKFTPVKGGIKLTIEVRPTEDTVIYFAEKHYLLHRIIKARRRALKEALYQKEIRKRVRS